MTLQPTHPSTLAGSNITLLLIRHAEKDSGPGADDKAAPISRNGVAQAQKLGHTLARLRLMPSFYLTSEHKHARQTAEHIDAVLGRKSSVSYESLSALTPGTETDDFEVLLEQAADSGMALDTAGIVALVGHEARLSRLLTRLTGKRERPFIKHAECAVVAADSLMDLARGQGKLALRIPVVDFQEDQLRSKVLSKMTVSTFFAGFTFAVDVDLLATIEADASWPQILSAFFLTLALALFIAAVYMYDRLSMPEGFWVFGERPARWQRWRPGARKFTRDREAHGPLYAYMIWTWMCVFTPAVLLGLAGFVLFLLTLTNKLVIIGGLVAIALVLLYYIITRPALGTD